MCHMCKSLFQDLSRSLSCQKCQPDHLKQCDQRKAIPKIPVPCFMMKTPHAQCAADTAAQQCHQKQCLFRDAPRLPFGTPFVHAHEAECDGAHKKQITQDDAKPNLFHCPSPLSVRGAVVSAVLPAIRRSQPHWEKR